MTDVRKKGTPHQAYITVTHGLSGYFAVMMWWNPEHGGFWEPYTTGVGRYAMECDAVVEAQQWANEQRLEYRP